MNKLGSGFSKEAKKLQNWKYLKDCPSKYRLLTYSVLGLLAVANQELKSGSRQVLSTIQPYILEQSREMKDSQELFVMFQHT